MTTNLRSLKGPSSTYNPFRIPVLNRSVHNEGRSPMKEGAIQIGEELIDMKRKQVEAMLETSSDANSARGVELTRAQSSERLGGDETPDRIDVIELYAGMEDVLSFWDNPKDAAYDEY